MSVSQCRDVGAVAGERELECVPCRFQRRLVGDDEGEVLGSAAGHADVEASAGRCRRREGQAAVGGDALGAVLAGGVGEFNVLCDVRGREGRRVVSLQSGDRDAAARVGGGDGPSFLVADVVASGGAEAAVVVSGSDDVADHRPLVTDRDERVGVELAGGRSPQLDTFVDGCDVRVAGGRDGERLASAVAVEPDVGDGVEVLVEASRPEAAERLVEVE